MAHERADRPRVADDQVSPIPGEVGAPPESAESSRDLSSVDKLLALTEDGWDIDEQLKTLKQAAFTKPMSENAGRLARPGLHLPTPFELSPTLVPNGAGATALAAMQVHESGPPPSGSKPPPLPPRATRSPPPLPPTSSPRKAADGASSPAPPVAAPLQRPASVNNMGDALLRQRASHVSSARTPEPSITRAVGDRTQPGTLIDLLNARLATLENGADRVALARTHMELAVASETVLADDVRATIHAEAALKVDPTLAAAHALLRRRKHARAALPAMLAHLDQELAAATAEASVVELLVEKARLLEAAEGSGARSDAVRATWEQALAHAPNHAAALKGLEAELSGRAAHDGADASHEAYAAHLARAADSYASEPKLAAWLHVERAQILERKLGRTDSARGAFERALELDPATGPVREAFVRHVSRHADWTTLAKLFEEEAAIETFDSRSARLELDAACIATARLGDDERAIRLLERAATRAPSEPTVDRRVLDELVRLNEGRSRWAEAARARRARLRFMTEPRSLAHELRALAILSERLGDRDAAIGDVQRALTIDANDPTLTETLDRLLGAAGRDEQRVALWLTEAARTDDATKRARALGRAAQISEHVLGRPIDAVRHLRSAWIAAPGDAEVLDALARLLAPSPSEATDREVRALIDLYSQAKDHARDSGRRIACLERVALLWEELLGEALHAMRVYEEILALDPNRLSAILGLGRAATRLGEPRAVARALLEEARLTEDGGHQLALRTRAATALAKIDPSRAFVLVNEVLEQDSAHTAARALETRLNDEAGRWELAARSMRARIEIAPASEKVGLWLSLAQMQDARLHASLEALASLQAARALDPENPIIPEEIARVLEATSDYRSLRSALEQLASHATSAEERARHLLHAAEIDELRLGDDVSAVRLYQRALVELPDDELIAERVTRALARRADGASPAAPDGPSRALPERGPHLGAPASARTTNATGMGEIATLLSKRIDRATSPTIALDLSFELATLLAELGIELPRAAALLDTVLGEQPDHIPALRALEALRKRAGEWAPLARVLSRQGDAFVDARARLGSLWSLAALEEWRLPVSDASATYRRILELDPTDPGALEATLRRDLPAARRGDAKARRTLISALRPLVALAPDESTRLAIQLRLALMLEPAAADADGGPGPNLIAQEALERYRDALRMDELSVTAATGLARLANKLGDAEGAVAAASALAELAVDPRVRSRYLVDAAELLLGPDDDDRLGTQAKRRERAAVLLERALDADGDSIPAAGRLATILLDGTSAAPPQRGQNLGDRKREGSDRLVVAFRAALLRAKSPDAIVMLGSEIARVARDDLKDLTIAIDAMRRVRSMAPQHVPSLLTLAELCIAQRAWPEAVEALEAVVTTSHEVAPRLTALFALASVYEKVLSRPEDMERVLRAALALDPSNPRALRALLRRIAALSAADNASAKERGALGADATHADETSKTEAPAVRAAARITEAEELLTRLAEVEKDVEQKSSLLLELAEVRVRLSDSKRAESALVEAVAYSPQNARAFARLAAFYKGSGGPAATRDHAGYARALASVIALGQQLGQQDPRWFASLGQLEVESLSRMREGIAHLQRAVQMDPSLFETRYELASAFARMSANEDAMRVLFGMVSPSPRPLLALADPAAALELFERTLGAERRAEEAIVVSELRAIEGELDDGRHAWLRARRVGAFEAHHAILDRPTLVTHVLPAEGRHILLEVAAAIAGIEAKVLRADLSELGISSRDRVSARSGHPTRALLDRLVKQLGLAEVELVISANVSRTRVLAQDVPWVAVPHALTELSEPAQLASLGRAVARIAFGVPWLEELPPLHIEALLIAAARQVVPGYAADDIDVLTAKLVTQHEGPVAKALSRRQKKILEELAPHIAAPAGRTMPAEAFVSALARAEMRTSYLLGGDLLATIDELRAMDATLHRATESPSPTALAAVLEHPYAGDIARFALTSEATALRRRGGASWTG